MIEPALKTKKPNNHPIIRITATIYNKDPIVLKFYTMSLQSLYQNRFTVPYNENKAAQDSF
jgi:hypothetical protein